MPENRFQILHISDLHISTRDTFDLSVVLDPLIERVEEDRDNGISPEIVVVTGNVAYQGIEAEYEEARKFLDKLLYALGLERERLFIVPGNHDVNRKKYPPSVVPAYKKAHVVFYGLILQAIESGSEAGFCHASWH
ncbi:MAG: hypothetical protein GY737_31250 [Desulfobacteraceae bacterium]|nr:hypothetical protein [Desulfobacteraceae bacterium]